MNLIDTIAATIASWLPTSWQVGPTGIALIIWGLLWVIGAVVMLGLVVYLIYKSGSKQQTQVDYRRTLR